MTAYSADVAVTFEADSDDEAIAFWQELPGLLASYAGGSRPFSLQVWELTNEETYEEVISI